jgi:hypothetical protein
MNIVRRSAPFGKFPPNMLSDEKDDLWVIVTALNLPATINYKPT